MLFWGKSTYRPYLKEGRLPNVLAALQVMATAVRSERTIENWAFVLDRNREISTVDKWKTVFKEHQEFFLTYLSDEKDMAALRWRYVTKLYDAKTGKYAFEEKEHLEDEEHPESAAPLASGQVATLINAAIELHSREMAEKTAAMSWVQVFTAFLGFLGAVGGVVLTAMLGIHK